MQTDSLQPTWHQAHEGKVGWVGVWIVLLYPRIKRLVGMQSLALKLYCFQACEVLLFHRFEPSLSFVLPFDIQPGRAMAGGIHLGRCKVLRSRHPGPHSPGRNASLGGYPSLFPRREDGGLRADEQNNHTFGCRHWECDTNPERTDIHLWQPSLLSGWKKPSYCHGG